MAHLPAPRPLAPDEQLYFLHIPKTAGTTLRTYLENHFDAPSICPTWLMDDLLDKPPSWFRQYRLLCGHYGWMMLEMMERRPRMATILREPEDWARSAYKHVLTLKEHWLHNRCKDMSFEDFVLDELGEVELLNMQTRFLALDSIQRDLFGHNHMADHAPRALRDKYRSEDLLQRAMTRLDEVDFVGIVERFDDSLALLAHQLGWPPPRPFPKYNISNESNRLALSERGLGRLKELTAQDRVLYARAKELFETRFSAYDPAAADAEYTEVMSRRPKVNRLDIRFDQTIYGHGWLPRERLPDGITCRWTGPTRDASMDICLSADRDYEIRFRAGTYSRELLESMTLTVNGERVALSLRNCKHAVHTQGIFSGRIPRAALAVRPAYARMEFSVESAIRPCDHNGANSDSRMLAAYFWWIDIFPS